jgi:hypothetical protein
LAAAPMILSRVGRVKQEMKRITEYYNLGGLWHFLKEVLAQEE